MSRLKLGKNGTISPHHIAVQKSSFFFNVMENFPELQMNMALASFFSLQ